ncbi:C40 family peptidase [Paenibacillus thalictri]|uniref:NlpC/P60 family protein n=1 Tax=Paenibacillus thalictri TaxID=2527873 RepID=A0A4Q9DJT3_9BACL|nr:C40 family peptidase [Paenibacillus thalictri]TBL74614.1 NlpC/P60 family protein [Paenibacillus thalictri]
MNKMITATVLALALMSASGQAAMAANATSSTKASTTSKADKIIKSAESYIGKVKYKYGVRDPQHLIFDCSAFTQFIFAKNGVTIPWGSTAQSKAGKAVSSKANLQKGDLVLFSVSKPGHIDHVGIYIGSGKMIHNHPDKGVEITDINSGYWKDRFITGRRV